MMVEKKKDYSENWKWLTLGAIIVVIGIVLNAGWISSAICFGGGYVVGHQLVEIFKKK